MTKQKRSEEAGTDAPSLKGGPARDCTGVRDEHLNRRLLEQATAALWLPQNLSEDRLLDRVGAVVAMLDEIAPTDGVEGALAVQMIATHEAALECLRRAMLSNQSFAGREQNLKHGAKLLSLYLQQFQALDKRRGKGQQKVTVEHVHVAAGGQAIVGNVEAGAAANLKPGGDAQPATIPHQPAAPIDLGAASRARSSRRRNAK